VSSRWRLLAPQRLVVALRLALELPLRHRKRQ
jgi:hypothetical protein